MKNKFENRIKAVRKSIFEKNLDCFMVLIDHNRHYLSGFTSEDTQYDESAGALFISDKKLVLATDSRYELQARSQAPLYEIVCYEKGLVSKLAEILSLLKTKRLCFESARISYKQFNEIISKLKSENSQVELVATNNIVENIRMLKEEVEVDAIKKALSVAESVFVKFVNTIKPGMTEKEAAWAMEQGMRKAGADSLSFSTIAASGQNSALPHAIPGNRRIKTGEPLLFDWGAKLNGYCSDISRTVVLGKPDNIFKKAYQTVLDAQLMAIDAVRPGISSKAVDHVARKHIDENGFKGRFGHGLGHGVGLAVHEAPGISPLKDTTLEAGMVFTVEPGIYIPGWGGIRIENMVIVRENGAEVLNKLDSENYQVPI